MKNVRAGAVVVVMLFAAASCSSSAAQIDATAADDEAAAASGAETLAEEAAPTVAPTPTAEPTATPEPEPTEPPPEPTAVPDAAEASADDADGDGAFVQCLARTAAGDEEFLKALTQIGTDAYAEIDDAQLDKLAASSVDCGLVEESLGTNDDATMELAAPCLNDRLTSADGGKLFVALSAVGQEVPVPEDLRPSFVGAMDSCLGASVMADAIVAEAELDPAMVGVFDRDCLVAEFEASGSINAIWEQVAIDPSRLDTFDAGADAAVAATVQCASMGAIVAAAAAEDGIEFSADTIACIDEKAAEVDITDAEAEDGFGVAMLSCLSEDELGALFNS